MANCCQNIRGNKTKKDQNDNKKQTNKQTKQKTKQQQNGRRGWGLKKQLTEWSSDVIIIDLRETERGRELKRVLLRLYHKQILADFYRFTSGRFGAKSRGL